MKQRGLGRVVSSVFAVLILISILFPIAWMVMAGFKGKTEVLRTPFQFDGDTQIWHCGIAR